MRQDKPDLKVNPPSIAICPHCGHKTPHNLLHREDFFVDVDKDTVDECWWAIMRCGSCGGMSLYKDHWDEDRKIWVSKLVYPALSAAPVGVPAGIRRLFAEAVSARGDVSPSLCAVRIRMCLEAVCIDKGAAGETLLTRMSELGQKGYLPEILVRMTDSRQISDGLGAHADSKDVTIDDIQILIDFCSAVLEFVYVASSKIAAVKMGLENTDGDQEFKSW